MKEKTPGPAPEIVKEWRTAAGMTQAAAADLVHVSSHTWAQWEAPAWAARHRTMPLGLFELFCIKAGKTPEK